jgi:hypothetical protein
MIDYTLRKLTRYLVSYSTTIHQDTSGDVRTIHWIHMFGYLKALENAIEEVRRQLVGHMRDQGASWDEVGDTLGITKQGAWERYKDVAPYPGESPAAAADG